MLEGQFLAAGDDRCRIAGRKSYCLPVAGLARTWDVRTYTGTLLALVTGRGCAYSYAYVEQCQHAKLVWGRELYIDGTKVQANASTDSLTPRFFVEAHLSTLFSHQAEEATGEGEQDASQEESASPELSPQGEQSDPEELPTSLSPEQRCELSQQNEGTS